MPLRNPYKRKITRKIKSDKQILKEQRINKLRKLEGKPLIDFGPSYKTIEEEYDIGIGYLLE